MTYLFVEDMELELEVDNKLGLFQLPIQISLTAVRNLNVEDVHSRNCGGTNQFFSHAQAQSLRGKKAIHQGRISPKEIPSIIKPLTPLAMTWNPYPSRRGGSKSWNSS